MKLRLSLMITTVVALASLAVIVDRPQLVLAQEQQAPLFATELETDLSATISATASATASATIASPSAEVLEKIQEKKDEDITDPQGAQKDKLVAFLEENPPSPINWNNFLQHGIRNAVTQGVPANIIVLVLLFPLIAALIGASRHVIGLRGFGIYIPAVLSVALVSTGVVEGVIIFSAIALAALATRRALKHTKISYLPRTALLLWTVSIGILGLLIAAPYIKLVTLMSLNIFPILILVLLSENFLDALQKTKSSDALALTLETLALAFISSIILQLEVIQKFALTEPELLIMGVAFFNILVGKFTGLRVTEFLRFRTIIEE